MKITCDFPGGNIKVLSVESENEKITVNLEQDLRDTDGWWFYWYFKVENAPEGEVDFCFHNRDVVCPWGPCTSTDGNNWIFSKEAFMSNSHFRFHFTGEKARYFCFSIPYVLSDFERFYASIKADNAVQREVLAISENGRKIPLLKIGNGNRDIVFTARHHCCESTASYVLEGVMASLLKDYREKLSEYTFHIVPFTDIDGVEQGDQGKNRIPHDHNRDYTDEPIYEYTRTIYRYTENMDICAFIDFHSPWSWGGLNDEPHIHLGPAVEPSPFLQDEFVKHLNEVTHEDDRDVIKYNCVTSRHGDNANLVGTESSKNFFKFKRGAEISFTVETPYSGNLSHAYTVEQLRIFGNHVAKALFKTL